MLVTTFSMTFSSCGGGDDDEPNRPVQPGEEITEYGGYVAKGSDIGVHYLRNDYFASIYPSSDHFEIRLHYTSPTKIAFIGNIKRIEDINGLNGSYEWKAISHLTNYAVSYENVNEKDCFLIEITISGSSYYYIYQFGPSKKNLSGDDIGYYYNLQSYNAY